MPRQPRVTSGTEIYHVMMRGINHQNIFEEPEDFYQFINILDRMRTQYDDEGNSCGTNCIYYAYCLMSNTFICSFVSVMRKLVILSRELQVHMSIITTINIFETVTYSRSVLRASQSARLCRSCNQRDARTIWLISRPFCAISTRILSKQVLLLRSRTISIAPGVNTMVPLNPSLRFVILKQ